MVKETNNSLTFEGNNIRFDDLMKKIEKKWPGIDKSELEICGHSVPDSGMYGDGTSRNYLTVQKRDS